MRDSNGFKPRSMNFANPLPVKVFRVFIAAPKGMEEERDAVNMALSSLFINKSIYHGVQFFPIHWYQLSTSGIGSPQSRINKVVMQCDFMIILFKDRWGTTPDAERVYSSGTEQEYILARKCIEDRRMPMKDLAILFGPIDERGASKSQIQKILSFKKRIKGEVQTDDYCSIDNLKVKVDTIVSNWLYSGEVVRCHAAPAQQTEFAFEDNDASLRRSIDEAVERLDSGETEPALTELAELSITGNWEARYKLGRSLKEQGKIDQALEILQELFDDLASSEGDADPDNIYLVKSELGAIFCLKNGASLVVAEQLHKDCLRYFRKNRQLGRIAVELRNLAAVYRSRSDTHGKAIKCIKDSIELYAVLPAQVDLGVAYLELGQMYIDCGNIDEAEQALKFAEHHLDSLTLQSQKPRLVIAKKALESLQEVFLRICGNLDCH